ncbi:GYDIA family GHMP kinase [Flavobacterium sp. RSSA_27]|uniref:GYDIA family GHMP kinase n=1 Tax=Flavobacterium sp. RSSA_27 TaxID=3447667 RepID=UPI003F33261A
MRQTFYSNGKLLLTGEYLVLDGATALALPTKYGQTLEVHHNTSNTLQWKSYDVDGSLWFEENLSITSILTYQPKPTSSTKDTLLQILFQAHLMQPSWLEEIQGAEISTRLSFPKKWGLGTSSTLINNIAQWAKVDAFELLHKSFGGSGYDIACAQHNTPILYQLNDQKPLIQEAAFAPNFTSNLFFVYLNQKQSSKAAIASYYNKKNEALHENITLINKLTTLACQATDLRTFARIMEQHETEMSHILELSSVQETLFPDFDGVIKSLGAWGGDFVLAIAQDNPTDYFIQRGYRTVLPYHEMILQTRT